MAEIKFSMAPWQMPPGFVWEKPPVFKYNETPVYENDTGLSVHEMTGIDDDTFALGHYYEVRWTDKAGQAQKRWIMFQDGTIPTEGLNGVTTEAMLAMEIHRTETMNARFPCDENELAILHMKKALEAFDARTAKRKARGVEGQHVK